MDYSAANYDLWNPLFQFGLIAAAIIVANILRRKVGFIRRSLMPTAVLGGFILLFLNMTGLLKLDILFMERVSYHFIAMGFIAMSLRLPTGEQKRGLTGLKSGAIIVGSYMIQGITGLVISLGLSYTIMPDLFKAAGILLPMGYGQGPGQAGNTGATYEMGWGFVGGRSFGLAIAAMGYICACLVGILYMNILAGRGRLKRVDHEILSGSVTIDTFQDKEEAPIAESIDRLSLQVALILAVYLVTYLVAWGFTSLLSALAPGVANMLNSLIWGFNFMIGSGLAILTRCIINTLRSRKMMKHQFQNNYLLSRLSGLAFDIMIVAGIGSIKPEELKGLWLPFILMSLAGAVVTLIHLNFTCKKVYKGYFYEGLISMYGMMTGTISSGVLLLRELDPEMTTPAAGNLVVGSSFAILLGAPLLVLVGMAPQNDTMTWIVLGLLVVYYGAMLAITAIKEKNR